jgi:hypothetical protein
MPGELNGGTGSADRTSTMAARKDPRELAFRSVDGLEVSLLWSKRAGTLTVAVADARIGDSFELAFDHERALDAFYHPFAFAAARGIEYRTAARDEGETVYA